MSTCKHRLARGVVLAAVRQGLTIGHNHRNKSGIVAKTATHQFVGTAPAHCAHFVNASFAVKEGYGCKVKGCDFTSALHASFDHLGFRLSCAERLGGAIKLGLFAVGAIQ